ncbi:hypothetical protein J0656_17385 [Muricauda ruestringensis]|uniref:Uncharacterized protein n=1 Tax=Flagellimonas aurea TaxID=2915619 RepID=A0ABS3G8S9_9FLAO|nr:hypothetical protein [Allomuricauda aurea]MBO0355795.1 hypothetical protein [Allomuricauda aurea]|tara:strand:+ start:9227 stop:9559 length:333 start_codon:yes stop_codon:yes gene_type:complete
MTISLGVEVALFEPGEQQKMLESLEGEYQGHRIKRMIESRSYDLTKACFDVTDKTLMPKSGACVVCPFNAANQGKLFGEGMMVFSELEKLSVFRGCSRTKFIVPPNGALV